MSPKEIVVMVMDSETETWTETVMTEREFTLKKANWEAMSVDDYERMLACDPNIETVSPEDGERYGFTETALDFAAARDGASLDNTDDRIE